VVRGAKASLPQFTLGYGNDVNNVCLGCSIAGPTAATLDEEDSKEEERRKAIEECVKRVRDEFGPQISALERIIESKQQLGQELTARRNRLIEQFYSLKHVCEEMARKAEQKWNDCEVDFNACTQLCGTGVRVGRGSPWEPWVPPWYLLCMDVCLGRRNHCLRQALRIWHDAISCYRELDDIGRRIRALEWRIRALASEILRFERRVEELKKEMNRRIEECHGKTAPARPMIAEAPEGDLVTPFHVPLVALIGD